MTDPVPQTRIVETGETLMPTGTYRGPDAHEAFVDFDEGRWTLTGLAGDFTIYSAALLGLTGVHFDPVALYWEEEGLPAADTPYELVHDRPVLAGLPPPLDHTLYACPRAYADGLLRFLDRFAARAGEVVMASVKQKVPVVDWRLLAKTSVAPARPPTVDVYLYGIEDPQWLHVWRPPADPWREPVRLVRRARPAPPTTPARKQWPGMNRRKTDR